MPATECGRVWCWKHYDMATPIPSNEVQRLEALRDYHILDTVAEQSYDDITMLAAHICGVPIAMVSLVDKDRQWFKSKVGVVQQQTPRDVAFCAHTILGQEPLVVPDALEDKRFAESALVKGEPHIRFYAGVPLINPEGSALERYASLTVNPVNSRSTSSGRCKLWGARSWHCWS